jgi:hypothetical protein
MMTAVQLPVDDVDTVTALRLMNWTVMVGELTQDFDPAIGSLCMKNIFGPPGDQFEKSLAGLPLYLPQLAEGRLIIATQFSRGYGHWRKALVGQVTDAQTNYLRVFALSSDGTCRHTHVLTAVDRALEELRSMVAKTPIRI